MDSSVSFHQQIKGRLLLIAFLFSISFFLILAAFYQSELSLLTLNNETLPAIEKKVNNHRLLTESEQLLTNVLIDHNPQRFETWLLLYQQNLQALIYNQANEKQLARRLLTEIEPFILSVKRLSVNNEKNEQLKQSTIVQLQIVNTALTDALLNVSLENSDFYQHSINVFSQAIIMAENLSVSTNIDRFTEFTNKLNTLMQQWLEKVEEDETSISPKVVASLTGLNNLLWIDQRSIAKWRSHIRISQEFISLVSEHRQTLTPLIKRFTLSKQPSHKMWPEILLSWLPPAVTTSQKVVYIIVAAIFSLLLIILFFLLYLLYQRIKFNQRHSIALIEEYIQGEVNSKVLSGEQQKTLDLLNQLTLPEHSENDYQRLKSTLNHQALLISRHANTLAWDTRVLSDELSVMFRQMLNLTEKQRWYHGFSRQAVQKLVAEARAAKSDKGIVEVVVSDKQGRKLNVTLEFIDNGWQGTLSVKTHQVKLEQDVESLNQQLLKAEQNQRLQQVNFSQKLNKRLVRAILQSQSASLGYGVPSIKVYRHLMRMLEWSKQLQLFAILRAKDRQVQLTDVSFLNELYTLIINVLVNANLQRNTVSYSVDNNVIDACKLNTPLFHQTLNHFCQMLLKDQFKAALHLAVSMVDKNSGQQILNFVFTVTHLESKAEVPDVITALLQSDEQQIETKSSITQYFFKLFKVTYCDRLQTKTVENGYQVSFNIPITTAASSLLSDERVDFNQRNLLLLSNDSLTITSVEQFAKKHQATLTTITKTKHFIQQVNVKHLTKKALDLVIVADDIFNNDFEMIQRHIAGLPKGLIPKVFVLQPLCNQAMHRVGLFKHTPWCLNSPTFAASLKRFIKGTNATNLLLAADIFQQYRFVPTNVEVLLAVKKPEQHEVLQRLLHWMGLQVHLVCNQQQMLKEWKSGRFLILLNEFEVSPLIALDVGKKVKRSIYAFSTQQLEQYQNNVTPECSHWEVKLLPNILDVAALVNGLSTWLKEQPLTRNLATQKSQQESVITKNPVAQAPIENTVKGGEEAFDLVKYAHNQGSSELAAFMILDYIDEIEANIVELIESIATQQTQKAERALKEIITIAKIMAADNLLQSCKVVECLLSDKNFEGCSEAMLDIKNKYQLLADYAQAI